MFLSVTCCLRKIQAYHCTSDPVSQMPTECHVSIGRISPQQGRLWILHHQKACCGRRCKLWSIDGRGGTVSGEVKSLFIISACAASIVSICIKMCRIFIQLSFVFLQYKIPWSISKAEVWVHTTKSKNFCLSYCKFGQQWQHKLRS